MPKKKNKVGSFAVGGSFGFHVYTFSHVKENDPMYSHWAKDLNMSICKNGVSIDLNSDEIQQLVKALPRTIGGTY